MLAAGLIAAAQLAGDRSRLDHLKAVAIQDMRAAVRQDVLTVKAQLSAAANLGIDPDDLSPVRGDLQAIERDATVIASLPGLSQLSNRADSLTVRLKTLEDNLSAEKAAVQQAAVNLAAQYQGRLDAMRAAGLSALTDGRNEATVGAFLKIPAVSGTHFHLNAAGTRAGRTGQSCATSCSHNEHLSRHFLKEHLHAEATLPFRGVFGCGDLAAGRLSERGHDGRPSALGHLAGPRGDACLLRISAPCR